MQRCGLDEAGRGALAGPLVAAAVIGRVSNIRDGKLLSAKQRENIYKRLGRATIAVEVISARSINNHGIGWANKEIFRRLLKKVSAEKYIVDGNLKIKGAESIVNADATIPEVICAGIVAKVERDKLMREIHKVFPQFGWNLNKGYGTKAHIEAIQKHGVCRYHRTVFVNTALTNHKQG